MGLIVKILCKIYKTPLILLHAARLKTWMTGLRPAVKLERPALVGETQDGGGHLSFVLVGMCHWELESGPIPKKVTQAFYQFSQIWIKF